jgi:hypothetical protein
MEPPSVTIGERRVLSPIRQKQIMRACDNRCDCCRQQYPRYILDVHVIGEGRSANPQEGGIDERHVLVLCAQCWYAMKALPGSDAMLRSIPARRPPEIRAKIQRILDRKSAPYMPETEFDLAELFAEAYDHNAMDLFLNGM